MNLQNRVLAVQERLARIFKKEDLNLRWSNFGCDHAPIAHESSGTLTWNHGRDVLEVVNLARNKLQNLGFISLFLETKDSSFIFSTSGIVSLDDVNVEIQSFSPIRPDTCTYIVFLLVVSL